jgi:hypothetical protein
MSNQPLVTPDDIANHCTTLISSFHTSLQHKVHKHFIKAISCKGTRSAHWWGGLHTSLVYFHHNSPSRSFQTFAFACLALSPDRARVKQNIIGKSQSVDSFPVESSNHETRKVDGHARHAQTWPQNALVVGQHAFGLPPLPCPLQARLEHFVMTRFLGASPSGA